MIDKVKYDKCCLCRACSDACPTNAITFDDKYKGFFYPVIDSEKCIKCNKCECVCPALNSLYSVEDGYPKTFAAKSRDEENRANSSSGGIFFELAQHILKNNGYVAGAVFDDDFNVKHILTNDISIVKRMRGSKYAQSFSCGEFKKIKELLDSNISVLFCGCPCQVAGLKHFLRKDYDNLFIIDFVCHGIPSQEMLDEYIKYLEKRFGSKVTNIRFRDKTLGWDNCNISCEFENGSTYKRVGTIDPYMRGFLAGINMKEACYYCKYKSSQSGSDLTVCDFWGAAAEIPQLNDNKGLSGVFANTEKGLECLSALSVDLYSVNVESITKYNRNYYEPTEKNAKSDEFFETVEKEGYEIAIKRFFCESLLEKTKRKTMDFIRGLYHKLKK